MNNRSGQVLINKKRKEELTFSVSGPHEWARLCACWPLGQSFGSGGWQKIRGHGKAALSSFTLWTHQSLLFLIYWTSRPQLCCRTNSGVHSKCKKKKIETGGYTMCMKVAGPRSARAPLSSLSLFLSPHGPNIKSWTVEKEIRNKKETVSWKRWSKISCIATTFHVPLLSLQFRNLCSFIFCDQPLGAQRCACWLTVSQRLIFLRKWSTFVEVYLLVLRTDFQSSLRDRGNLHTMWQ